MGYLSKTTRLLYDRLHHFPIKGTYDAALDTTVDIPKTTFFKVPRQATGFWGREYDVRYLLEFKIISSFFIDEHKLPRTFDFAHYLAASLGTSTGTTADRHHDTQPQPCAECL